MQKISKLILLAVPILPITSCSTYKLNSEYQVDAGVYQELTSKFGPQLTEIMKRYDENQDGTISREESRKFMEDVDKALKLFYLFNKKK